MKTPLCKFIIPFGFLFFLVACSTKRNTFLSRNSHALSTEYNILYNGQIGLDKGIDDIKSKNVDNFWKRLPIERMQVIEELPSEKKAKNANFELAETKATKAIQKHSMNIGGKEKNTQIDEAYLLLGKTRYYDQRFVPAIDAFNYILYKYPNSSRIYEAKIWREKTNMRMGNDALVVNNINWLLKDKELNKQIFSDANALLSEAFLNLDEKDSAVVKLKIAEKFTTKNTQRARYRFILGQLYEELGKKDSAILSYKSVIKMNRKSERKYVIQSHARKAQLFDYEKGDTVVFLKTFKKLIKNRENRPFLDVLNHQMGIFYDKQDKEKQALTYYNRSLKKATADQYLVASNYRNLGNMYFKKANYPLAAKYYDSTLVKLDNKTREYVYIQKIRKDLDDVIVYEAIATRNDSIIKLVFLPKKEKVQYFENYIEKLKKADEAKRVLEEKEKEKQENIERNSKTVSIDPAISGQLPGNPSFSPPSMPGATNDQATSVFYFYNPTAMAFGKVQFKKTWGNRSANGNWRLSSTENSNLNQTDIENSDKTTLEDKLVEGDDETKIIPEYTTDFYLKQLPTKQEAIDSISKERNLAYYQLGVIYKEKFKKLDLASTKLEKLLQNNPEEKLILPAMYNLYKIYQITDSNKAEAMKNRISTQFPNSRYAQIINNTNPEAASRTETPDEVYNKWYKLYTEDQLVAVLENSDILINQFSGEEIVSKFELLKANTIGKLKGLIAYKNALQHVADNYPNTEEGKNAKEILAKQIPMLEQMDFKETETNNWKVLYRIDNLDVSNTKKLATKIKFFIATNNFNELSYSYDFYNEKEGFITIHGFNSKAFADNIVSKINEDKSYKIEKQAIVISSENYKIAQIKKNLDAYPASKN